ncbi:MAG: YbaK/EbsC family protein [bacterium]
MKSFDSIKQRLDVNGVKYEVVTFTDTAISARIEDTSLDHNYDPNNSIKTLIISTHDGYKGIILRGSDRIDQPKLKALVGKWRVVDGETLQKELEYIPGTICPLDLDMPIVIEQSALELKTWSMGAGANDKGFNVEVNEAIEHLPDHRDGSFKLIS